MDNRPTPVTVLTGFLGAGKTTLLNRILQSDHGLRIGVFVNDFGTVNIDARLVAGIEGDAISLTNGCVCCSMRGDLVASVLRLLERPNPPEYLVIEASGIADPLAIAAAFRTSRLRGRTRLDAIVTIVDAENARDPRLDAQLVEDQIRAADIVLLNKIDLVGAERRAELRVWIQSLVPRARIIETVQAYLPIELLLETRGTGSRPLPNHDHDHDQDHGQRFATWSYCTDKPLAYRKVRKALESLPPSIFRAKGILALADAPALRFAAQLVGKRVDIDVLGPWDGERPGSELVFIGEPNALKSEELDARFEACCTDAIALLPYRNFQLVARAVPTRAAVQLAR